MANVFSLIERELGLFFNAGKYAEQEYFSANYGAAAIDPNLVMLESFWGTKITCNPYAIYRRLRDDPEYEHLRFVWSAQKGTIVPPDVESDARSAVVIRHGVAYAKSLLAAKYVVSNSTLPEYYIRHPDQVYANTWHGVPLKFMGYDADPRPGTIANSQHNFLHATHILLAGEYAARKTVESYGAYGHMASKITHVGSPRVDTMLTSQPGDVRRRLGIRPGRKLAVFAPTWRGLIDDIKKDSTDIARAAAAITAAAGAAYDLVVSAHNFVHAQVRKDAPGIHLVPDDLDINEVLGATDVLVSDYSSIVVDYLVLDRPIILYVPDRADYEKTRGLYISLDELPAAIATNGDGLVKAFASPAKPSHFESYDRMRRLLVPFEDGNAAARAVATMMTERPTAVPAGERKHVAIHPGAMKTNGITSSFLNLQANLNRHNVLTTVLLAASALDRHPSSGQNMLRIAPSSQVIVKGKVQVFTRAERQAFGRWMRKKEFTSAEDLRTLHKASVRECRRIAGGLEFDAAVDFGGYAERWSMIMARMPAGSRAIYQHNDLWAEATNHDHYRDMEHLHNVFETYRLFDRIISVSPELMKVNLENLAKYYRSPDVARSVRNTIVAEDVRERAAAALSETAPGVPAPGSFDGAKRLMMLGRLSPEKNPIRMLDALRVAVDHGYKLVLYVVGEGPLAGAVASYVRKLGLGQKCGAVRGFAESISIVEGLRLPGHVIGL